MSDRRRWALAFAAVSGVAAAQSGLDDPTRPTSLSEPDAPQSVAAQGPRWRLQSTLVADTRRVAVINGRTLMQGERIDGAMLVDVRPDGVTLEHEGRRVTLRLMRESLEVKRAGG